MLNVRDGPGTEYGVLGQVEQGDKLEIVERTEDGNWVKVRLIDGKEGWVSAEFVKVIIEEPVPLPPPNPEFMSIALETFHNLYVTVDNEHQILKGDAGIDERERFTLITLDNDKIALQTSHGEYVTAVQGEPWTLETVATELTKQGVFTLIDLGDDTVAFRTFYGRYVTAMEDDWDWMLRAETRERRDWEKFTIVLLE